MKIRIYKGTDIVSANYVDVEVFDAKVSRVLNSKDEITFKVESATALDIPINSTIAVNVGIYTRYYMHELPSYEKVSSTEHSYSLTFKSPLSDLEKIAFLDVSGNGDFYFNGTASDFIDLIVYNLGLASSDIASSWVAGSSDTTVYENIQFSNQNCWQAINSVMDRFELELKVTRSFTNYELALVDKVANSTAVSVAYGSGNGLFNIKRTNVDVDKLVTRLYYFGSIANLPPDYAYTRLRGSAAYIDQNISTYGRRDGFKTFEEIKPIYTGTISGTPAMNGTESLCSFIDSGFPFDLNEVDASGNTIYLIAGTTAKINFLTGNCAGVTCDISSYDHDTNTFQIIPYEYENGYKVPNSTVIPTLGNTFKIFDIMMPASYVVTAVSNLDSAAADYIAKYSTPRVQYALKTDTKYFYDNSIELDLGDQITVVDADLNISEDCRVIEVSFSLFDRFDQIVKLSDVRFAIPARSQATFLKKIEKVVEVNNLDNTEKTTRSQKTTTEVKNRTFAVTKQYSPEAEQEVVQEYFISENNAPESIDPYMLSLDSGEPQFILDSVITAAETSISIADGTFIHRSYNALTRDKIQKKLNASETYDPKQVWVIAAQSINITAATAYYIYVKVDNSKNANGSLAGTTATMHVSTEILTNKYTTDDYLYFLIGKVSETRALSLLWGDKDKHYTHEQSIPASTWTVTHNLGKKPAVSVTDSAGTAVHGEINYIDLNQVELVFNAAFSGVAVFN
jgi:hypothetical protein